MEKLCKCTRYKGDLGADRSLRQKRENRRKGDLPVKDEQDTSETLPRMENREWTPSSLYKSERNQKGTDGNTWNSERDIANKEIGRGGRRAAARERRAPCCGA